MNEHRSSPEETGAEATTIHVGTSGYSYEDWKGAFYPPGLARGRWLAHYSEHFDTVEVNATFYRTPSPRSVETMARAVPDGFHFVLKLPQELSHGRGEPEQALRAHLRSAEPLAARGALRAQLLQFPFSFRNEEPNRAYLGRVAGWLRSAPCPTAVEFRHASWQNAAVGPWLEGLGLADTAVDLPALEGLPEARAPRPGPLVYLRLHGRNARQWWRHEKAWQRYDYLYADDELRPWAERVHALRDRAQVIYVFFNNHFGAQAARNAQRFVGLLREAREAGQR